MVSCLIASRPIGSICDQTSVLLVTKVRERRERVLKLRIIPIGWIIQTTNGRFTYLVSSGREMSQLVSKVEILSLYRNLYKASKKFVLTDREYYRGRLRMEFTNIPSFVTEEQRFQMYSKGLKMFENNVGGIM